MFYGVWVCSKKICDKSAHQLWQQQQVTIDWCTLYKKKFQIKDSIPASLLFAIVCALKPRKNDLLKLEQLFEKCRVGIVNHTHTLSEIEGFW